MSSPADVLISNADTGRWLRAMADMEHDCDATTVVAQIVPADATHLRTESVALSAAIKGVEARITKLLDRQRVLVLMQANIEDLIESSAVRS